MEASTDVNLEHSSKDDPCSEIQKADSGNGNRTSNTLFEEEMKKCEEIYVREPSKTSCYICKKEKDFRDFVCISCQARLCKDCYSTHKSCDHIVVSSNDFLINKFPCLTCNEKAAYHCSFCHLDFCDKCKAYHQDNGLSGHEWIDIITHAFSLRKGSPYACSTCEDGENKPAVAFCITCPIQSPMCESCCLQHNQRFYDHTLCYNIQILETHDQEENEISDKLKCTPCAFVEEDNEAAAFCLTCKETELMCDTCAEQHIKERDSRDHELCYDLEKGLSRSQSNGMLCENCKKKGENQTAIAFCLTCEHPEPLCNICEKTHAEENQGHEIRFNILQLTKCILCEPCFHSKVELASTHFCLDCHEPVPMCELCANKHLKLRSGRGHRLCNNISEFSGVAQIKFHILPSIHPSSNVKRMSPGKPKAMNIKSDSITIFWTKSAAKVRCYKIQYKRKENEQDWTFVQTEKDENTIHITELKADTRYIIQVQGVNEKQTGSFGPTNEITTSKSLGSILLQYSIKSPLEGCSHIHHLVADEQRTARNEVSKIKKLLFGNPRQRSEEEKTIMLVGATGTGKSTLVDGFINYLMGVKFDDEFRFTLVKLEKEEQKTHDQAVSQTEWITVYRIAPREGSLLNYTLNIIDTPGFGDTRGIQQDQKIIDQIRHLFTSTGDQGVLSLDAVCFLYKAPDARLTALQKYIFSSIMSLFGKDIEPIICTFITFADGAEPPVLASLKKANLPLGSTFQFNNSALFVKTKNEFETKFPNMFWDLGNKSFKTFFEKLPYFGRRSLTQTNDVLREREQLKSIIADLQSGIKVGLIKLATLRKTATLFKDHEAEIKRNEKFEYEVNEEEMYLEDVPHGRYITNCMFCNTTCHKYCAYADDEDKIHCSSMSNGNCTVCPAKCIWTKHKNAQKMFEIRVKKVKKTYEDIKAKYTKAKGEEMTVRKVIYALLDEVNTYEENVMKGIEEMRRCKNRLSEIALQPDPLNTEENINLMILAEETEMQEGYEERLQILYEFRNMARIEDKSADVCQQLQKAKMDVTLTVCESESTQTINKEGRVSRFARNIWKKTFGSTSDSDGK